MLTPSAHCDWLASPFHPFTFPIFSPFLSFHLSYLFTSPIFSPFHPFAFLSFHLFTFSPFLSFHPFNFPIFSPFHLSYLFTFSPFHLSYPFTLSPSLCFSIALKAIGKQAQGTGRPLSKLRGRHSKRLTKPAQELAKG